MGMDDAMTVGKLIELLKTYPEDMMVVTSGYEGGYQSVGEPEPKELVLNVNDAWHYGPHEEPWDDEKYDYKTYPGKPRTKVVCL